MPFQIIRQDITKVKCDAIVNAANNSLLGGGGVDGAIHRAAGPELLAECKTLNGCKTGDAKITKGYKLPCKYVIHTVGPIWHNGRFGEEEQLRSCYRRSFELAKEHNCESIAFPLISGGAYGYPKDEALKIAIEETQAFLKDNEMQVNIVVFDKDATMFANAQYYSITEYIDDNYTGNEHINDYYRKPIANYSAEENICRFDRRMYAAKPRMHSCAISREEIFCERLKRNVEHEIMLQNILLDEPFATKLIKLIDAKHITDVECYKKANVSRQTWHKIVSDKDYKPSKNTVLCFAIALELSFVETTLLLQSAGYALSKSILFDVIVEYFIKNEKYDIFEINETLFAFDQQCLGV